MFRASASDMNDMIHIPF